MESNKQTAESGLVRIGEPETPLAELLEWQTMAVGAYSKNTGSGAEGGWGGLSGVL